MGGRTQQQQQQQQASKQASTHARTHARRQNDSRGSSPRWAHTRVATHRLAAHAAVTWGQQHATVIWGSSSSSRCRCRCRCRCMQTRKARAAGQQQATGLVASAQIQAAARRAIAHIAAVEPNKNSSAGIAQHAEAWRASGGACDTSPPRPRKPRPRFNLFAAPVSTGAGACLRCRGQSKRRDGYGSRWGAVRDCAQ